MGASEKDVKASVITFAAVRRLNNGYGAALRKSHAHTNFIQAVAIVILCCGRGRRRGKGKADSAVFSCLYKIKEMSKKRADKACCRHTETNRSAAVNRTQDDELTVVVHDGADQPVLLQHGEELQGLRLAEDVAALQALDPCHQVIHLDPCPVVRQLPPSGRKLQ